MVYIESCQPHTVCFKSPRWAFSSFLNSFSQLGISFISSSPVGRSIQFFFPSWAHIYPLFPQLGTYLFFVFPSWVRVCSLFPSWVLVHTERPQLGVYIYIYIYIYIFYSAFLMATCLILVQYFPLLKREDQDRNLYLQLKSLWSSVSSLSFCLIPDVSC